MSMLKTILYNENSGISKTGDLPWEKYTKSTELRR